MLLWHRDESSADSNHEKTPFPAPDDPGTEKGVFEVAFVLPTTNKSKEHNSGLSFAKLAVVCID